MKNEKLTVLDFKKEQLVNLNEEDMMAVKGGHTSMPCFNVSMAVVNETKEVTKDASWWRCAPTPKPDNEFVITQHQVVGVTCYSVPPVVIYGY